MAKSDGESLTVFSPLAGRGGRKWPLLTLLISAAACGTGTGPGDNAESACARAQALRPSPGFLGVAREADIAARVVPGGFGSLYQDFSKGQLVVYLKDLSQISTARSTLSSILRCEAAYPGWADTLLNLSAMVFHQGQYTGTELLSWLQALEPLRNDPAVWAIEVDPERNRIWVGLSEAAAGSRIATIIAGTVVPAAAVTVEVPPPATGLEPLTVLNSPVATRAAPGMGIFELAIPVRYTNASQDTRFLGQCVLPTEAAHLCYYLEKWDDTGWNRAYSPIYGLVALKPRALNPGQAYDDSLLAVAVRRLNTETVWQTARVTGTYRLIARVYLTEIPSPPFVGTPAGEAERVSAPFRILNTAPF